MSVHLAKPEHEATYQELTALIQRHAKKLSAMEVLAIAANMVGKLIAMQDQRVITPDMALKVVSENIEMGNRQVLEALIKTEGKA